MYEQTIAEKIRQRRRQIFFHRCLYYVYDTNCVTDYQFDKWYHELINLEEQYPEIAEQVEFHHNSPSKTVGSNDPNDYPLGILRLAERYASKGGW